MPPAVVIAVMSTKLDIGKSKVSKVLGGETLHQNGDFTASPCEKDAIC